MYVKKTCKEYICCIAFCAIDLMRNKYRIKLNYQKTVRGE